MKKMAPPRIYCCSNGCLNSSVRRPELSFFKLPRDAERRNEWLRLISREDLADKKAKSYVVCEEHFHAHEILRAEHRKNLKKNAVPSLNLPDMQSKEVVAFEVLLKLEANTQTEESDANFANQQLKRMSSVNIRKRKLKMKQIQRAKRIQLEEVEKQSEKEQKEVFHKLCDKFLNNEFSELVKAQSISQSNSAKKQYLSVTTEIDEKIISILKTKVENMTDKEKNCTVIIDTMDLKANLVYNTKEDKIIGFHDIDGVQTPEPATTALILMLRGIVVNWKQPVGYALLSEYRNYEEITKWIDNLLDRLFDIGLNIRAIVSDMGMDTYNLAKERPISPEKPFFSLRRKKLFYIFDTPDLIKMVRDSLLVNEFHFQGCVANFEPIVQFYNQNKEKSCSLVPKLTENHINPNNIEKKELRLATQLLSNSMAAGILTYIDFYVIDESGRDTVKVIKLMNDLFDLLNSADLQNENVLKKAFSGEPKQLHIFNEAINFFRTLKLVDPRTGKDVTISGSKFIEGFQITIGSIMLLLEDFRRKEIATCVRTRRLCKEATEKFFNQMRSMNGVDGEPSSKQFISGYRELFIKDIMKPTAGKDCSMELAKYFTVINGDHDSGDDVKDLIDTSVFTIDESENNVKVKSSEYNQLEIPDKNTVVYLSSYLLKRCSEKHKSCQILNLYIAPAPEQRIHNFGADVRYQRYREYSKDTCTSLLVVPYDDFITYVEMMEEEFRSCLKGKHVARNIAAAIYKEISELNFSLPCPCFPIVYLKKLFIRMRIFHTIQFNNKKMRASGSKRKYFIVPNL